MSFVETEKYKETIHLLETFFMDILRRNFRSTIEMLLRMTIYVRTAAAVGFANSLFNPPTSVILRSIYNRRL